MWSVEYIESSNLWGVYYNGVLQSTAEIEQEARELVAVLNGEKEASMDKPYENLSDDNSMFAAAVVLIAALITGFFSCAIILAVLLQV